MAQSAAAQTAPLQRPDFSAKTSLERALQATNITAIGDGCWYVQDGDLPEDGWFVDDEDDARDCITFKLRLSRNGRLISNNLPGFWSRTGDYPTVASHYQYWDCKRTGRYAYRVTYTNNSMPGYSKSKPYRAVKSGHFQVPRCRPVKPRRVDKGSAVRHAYDDTESANPNEFISSVQCSPASNVRNGRASKWRCFVTHNNTYRQCVRDVTQTYYSRDKFGIKKRDYSYTWDKSCRSF